MTFRETIDSDLWLMAQPGVSVSHGCFEGLPEWREVTRTLVDDEDLILALSCFRILNATTAIVWTDWTDEAYKNAKSVYRILKEEMVRLAHELGLIRLQAYVRTDFERGISMVEHMGFHRESIVKKFFGEHDGYMYVRLVQ